MKNLLFILSLIFVVSCNKEETVLVYERIIDGDTFVANGKKIRLWGIDAPEKNEPESFAASLYLETLLEQGELRCEFFNTDKYQRDVMTCYSDGHDIASDLVKMGMARDYKRYSKGYYDAEEKEAKANNRGIWSGRRI